MSHGIRQSDDGRATICVVDTGAWHGLTKPVKGPINMRRALKLAHMDNLQYQTVPMLALAGDEDDPEYLDTTKYTTVGRNPFDQRWEWIGGAVSGRYVLHTPEDIAVIGEALCGSGASVSAVGLIDEGRRMFASFKIRDYDWAGDKSFAWLNFYTDFTGAMATRIKPGATRVVCRNTFQIGLSEQVQREFVGWHTGQDLKERVEEARKALGLAERAFDEFEEEVRRLLDTDVTEKQFQKIVEEFAPIDKDKDTAAQKFAAERERDAITRVWKGATVQTIQGTAWGAYNALTEYIDWIGGSYRSEEARMVASLTPGSGMEVRRQKALTVVKSVVKV